MLKLSNPSPIDLFASRAAKGDFGVTKMSAKSTKPTIKNFVKV